ncbi:MAG: hypothetical protein WDM91_20045 [Rhizomicrobium sp.]
MFDECKDTKTRPPCRPYTGDDDLDRLLTPARYFSRPKDVLADATLSLSEKRAVLSSWASDACAVKCLQDLRLAPGGSVPVSFDAIVDALQRLDGLRDAALRAPFERQRGSGSHSASA